MRVGHYAESLGTFGYRWIVDCLDVNAVFVQELITHVIGHFRVAYKHWHNMTWRIINRQTLNSNKIFNLQKYHLIVS